MSRRRTIASALAGLCAVGLAATPASANGRFPAAGQVVIDPGDPSHIVIRATYGILQTTDGGATWRWMCEQSIGYGGIEDPAVAITGGGTLLAGIFEGLSVSPDLGCSWSFVQGSLAAEYVIDVTVEPVTPSHALAVTSTGSPMGFNVIVAESLDDGASWAPTGVAVDKEFLALTVEVAASDPNRIYLSGLYGAQYDGAIARTDDRGATWSILPFDLQGGVSPYIGAVDPGNPDRLYVRVDHAETDSLYFSDDGAMTWNKIAMAPGEMLGFALSPDGKKVAIGGPDLGLEVADTTDHAFSKAATLSVKCLKWHAQGLYACADEFVDKFTLGRSTDSGTTFQPIYHLPDLAPLECGAETSTGKECPAQWPGIAKTIGAESGSGGGGGSGAGAAGPTGAGGSEHQPNDDDDGCGVARVGDSGTERRPYEALAAALGCGALFAFARARRRRAAPR